MAIQPFTPPQFSAQQQEQQPQAKRQRGTGFTNIGRMLGANIGAGQQMGQRLGEVVGSQAGKVKEGVEKSAQQFRTGYEEAKKEGLGTIGRVGGLIGQVGDEGKVQSGEVGTGISGMSEEEAKKLGEQFANVKYAGPTQIGGQIGSRASALKGLAQGALTGQRNVLGSALGRTGPYSRGQSILDTALLGQDIAGQQAIRAANLEAARTAAMAQQQEQVAQNLAQQAQGLLGTGQPKSSSLKSQIEGKMLEAESGISEAAKKQAEQYYEEGSEFTKLLNKIASSTTEEPLEYSELTEKQKELLEGGYGKLGLGNIEQMSGLTSDEKKSVLNTLTQGFARQPNVSRFEQGQREALRNLQLLGGKTEEAKKTKEIEEGKLAFSPEKLKEAKDKTEAFVSARKSEAEKVINVGKQFADLLIRNPDLSVESENQNADQAIAELPIEIQKTIREWQGHRGRTVDQLAELIQQLGYQQLQQANKAYDPKQQVSFRNALLSMLGGAPVDTGEVQTINRPSFGTVKPKTKE
jgi:hypothetical protein